MKVYLSTIHKAKGKEFKNVIYFNLSKTDANSNKAQYVKQERRVAYVGATLPKDDLLVTFSSTKPSEFLNEMALNPKFEKMEDDELQREATSSRLRLEKEKVILKQREAKKEKTIAFFHRLTGTGADQGSAWSNGLLWKIQNWRIDRTKARIEKMDLHMKKNLETIIQPLTLAMQELEEEINLRIALELGTEAVRREQEPPHRAG